MKIFMATEFIDLSITIKIESDDGRWIILRGERCDDNRPVYGCNLNEGEQERLKSWLNNNYDSERAPVIREKKCCGTVWYYHIKIENLAMCHKCSRYLKNIVD